MRCIAENEEVPADPTLSFEAGRINVYENSHGWSEREA
jgi:hypothetical protein